MARFLCYPDQLAGLHFTAAKSRRDRSSRVGRAVGSCVRLRNPKSCVGTPPIKDAQICVRILIATKNSRVMNVLIGKCDILYRAELHTGSQVARIVQAS